MNLRYCITMVRPAEGYRMMKYPHNARGTYATEREARDHLVGMIAVNREEDLVDYLGDLEKLEIHPVECYPGGDPMRTVFE